MYTFDIVTLDRRSIAGDRLHTVVAYRDGVALGGDHHWVRRRYAERAAALYREQPSLHGRPSATIAACYLAAYRAVIFDPDCEA